MCKICEAMKDNAVRKGSRPYDARGAREQLIYFIPIAKAIKRQEDAQKSLDRSGQTSLF